MSDEYSQSWYEEASDPLADLRAQGVMARDNDKYFSKDIDLARNDKIKEAVGGKEGTKPNEPSKEYAENNEEKSTPYDNTPYDGYASGRM